MAFKKISQEFGIKEVSGFRVLIIASNNNGPVIQVMDNADRIAYSLTNTGALRELSEFLSETANRIDRDQDLRAI